MAIDVGELTAHLVVEPHIRVLTCPDCPASLATDDKFDRIEHHDDGSHTVHPARRTA